MELPLRVDRQLKSPALDENGVCELALDLASEVESLDSEGAQKTCINSIAKLIPILPYPYQLLQERQDESSQVLYCPWREGERERERERWSPFPLL